MSARTRRAGLVAVALAGLALAVALAILTSSLTTQHVGLAGEPPRPQSGLVAPPAGPRRPSQTVTTTVPSGDAGEAEGDD